MKTNNTNLYINGESIGRIEPCKVGCFYEDADLSASIIKDIGKNMESAFNNFTQALQKTGFSIRQFKTGMQNYIDNLNKMYKIGEYKVVTTKIPRKLKKKMKKQGKFALTLQKIESIKNLEIEVEVDK